MKFKAIFVIYSVLQNIHKSFLHNIFCFIFVFYNIIDKIFKLLQYSKVTHKVVGDNVHNVCGGEFFNKYGILETVREKINILIFEDVKFL